MKDDAVLECLRAAEGRHVSGEDISKSLRVTRTAVWKSIRSLKKLGYKIAAAPRLGYRFVAAPDKLFADEIARGLKTRVVGKRVFAYAETDSTNDVAWRLGTMGAVEGACVFTEFQKKGRGRLGRTWSAPRAKNVLVSVLLRPDLAPAHVSRLTLLASVAAARAVEAATGRRPGIKWPNDLLHDGQKLCGILTEMSAEADRVNFVVVGIGVNVNSSGRDLPPGATSLKKMAGKPVSRLEFARRLLAELDADYARFREEGFEPVMRDWAQYSVTTGRRVSASMLGRKLQGEATGIDSDGALWIRLDNGFQEKVTAGDVQHLR